MEIMKIEKGSFSNTVHFWVKVTPHTDLISQLAGTDALYSNLTLTDTSVSFDDPYLKYSGTFYSTLEGLDAQIFLKPTSDGPF